MQAQTTFGEITSLVGVEINHAYIKQAEIALAARRPISQTINLIHRSFFAIDWAELARKQVGQILVIGNPPWVTSSTLGKIESRNLPIKTKQDELTGIDAITGKSNFDISEWICLKLIQSLPTERSSFALLVKTTVARKVLKKAWSTGLPLTQPKIHKIDAQREFGVSVDACLFSGKISANTRNSCQVYPGLEAHTPTQVVGYEPPTLIADLVKHGRTRHLASTKNSTNWRSGVKHDCAKVLELRIEGDSLINGFDQAVEIESEFVFPLKKSSDIALGKKEDRRRIIITQNSTRESPLVLENRAPRLWAYLKKHADLFDARKSSIYRGRPPFSIFGVGSYSFSPYKVAISGLYKKLRFQLQGPIDQRPVLFDDTVYFLSFQDERSSLAALDLLSSQVAQDFFNARIFWDAKRPITATVLRSLCLEKLSSSRYRHQSD